MQNRYDHGGNIFDYARKIDCNQEDIADFSASINPLGISEKVRNAIINSLDKLIHYPDSGHPELKQALAEYHAVPANNLVIANGSTEIIYNLPPILNGQRALIIAPSFNEYERALNLHNFETEHFTLKPENGFEINLGVLKHALSNSIDVLYLCNPGNPNGKLYQLELIEKIYSLCIESGTFFVLDEAFMDFCENASAKHLIIRENNGTVLRSMTKFFGIPGLRLGYAIANTEIVEKLDAMGGPWSVNTLALEAGTASILDTNYREKSLKYMELERKFLFEKLSGFKQLKVYTSTTNFLLVELISTMTSTELKERLICYKILIRDCSTFRGLSERFFRCAVKSRAENQRLIDGLNQVFATAEKTQ